MKKSYALLGKAPSALGQKRINVALRRNKIERAKLEALLALHGGENLVGRTANSDYRKPLIQRTHVALGSDLEKTVKFTRQLRNLSKVQMEQIRWMQNATGRVRVDAGLPRFPKMSASKRKKGRK